MLQKIQLSRTQILLRAANELRSGLPIKITSNFQINYLFPAEFIHPEIEVSELNQKDGPISLYIRSKHQIYEKYFPSFINAKKEVYNLVSKFIHNEGLHLKKILIKRIKLKPMTDEYIICKKKLNHRLAYYATSFLSHAQLLPAALIFHYVKDSNDEINMDDNKKNRKNNKFNILNTKRKIDNNSILSLDINDFNFQKIIDNIYLIPGCKIMLPTLFGDFSVVPFRANTGEEHLAIIKEPLNIPQPILVRVHSSCFTGDILTSLKCDCGPQIQNALSKIAAAGSGVILYLSQEGRGIGLLNKMRAYNLQSNGMDTVDANIYLGFEDDQRHFGIAKKMLDYLNINTISLLTNNPRKVEQLRAHGINIVERIPIKVGLNKHNVHYLNTKRNRSQHFL